MNSWARASRSEYIPICGVGCNNNLRQSICTHFGWEEIGTDTVSSKPTDSKWATKFKNYKMLVSFKDLRFEISSPKYATRFRCMLVNPFRTHNSTIFCACWYPHHSCVNACRWKLLRNWHTTLNPGSIRKHSQAKMKCQFSLNSHLVLT